MDINSTVKENPRSWRLYQNHYHIFDNQQAHGRSEDIIGRIRRQANQECNGNTASHADRRARQRKYNVGKALPVMLCRDNLAFPDRQQDYFGMHRLHFYFACVVAICAYYVQLHFQSSAPLLIQQYDNETKYMDKEFPRTCRNLTPAVELIVKNHLTSEFFLQDPLDDKTQLRITATYLSRESMEQLLLYFITRVDDFITMGDYYSSNNYPVHAITSYYTGASIEILKDEKSVDMKKLIKFAYKVDVIYLHFSEDNPANSDIKLLKKQMVQFIEQRSNVSNVKHSVN